MRTPDRCTRGKTEYRGSICIHLQTHRSAPQRSHIDHVTSRAMECFLELDGIRSNMGQHGSIDLDSSGQELSIDL